MNDKLLKKADASGLFHLPADRHAAITASAHEARLCVLHSKLDSLSSSTAVLTQLGKALHFPIWYGANFDALYDCLSDPDWQPAKGHVLLVDGLADLQRADPGGLATLLEVFQVSVEARRSLHKPFWILTDIAAPGLATLPEA